MRYPLLISIFLFALLPSCNKDKFATRPSIKINSVNTTVLNPGQTLVFNLTFTDAEGDLTDRLTVVKSVANCPLSNFTDSFPLPVFPTGKNQKGEMVVNFLYNVGGINTIGSPQCPPQNDTAVFKFALKDKAQNISDTVVSQNIVIIN